jgi:hypothetical protein
MQLYSREKHGTGSVLKSVPRNYGGCFRKWAWFFRNLSVTQAFAVNGGILQVNPEQFCPLPDRTRVKSRSKWLNEDTTVTFWRARVTATFSRRRPPSGSNEPKRCGKFPALSLPYPMLMMIASLSSPWPHGLTFVSTRFAIWGGAVGRTVRKF